MLYELNLRKYIVFELDGKGHMEIDYEKKIREARDTLRS